MTLSQSDTGRFIELVLDSTHEKARATLHAQLKRENRNEGEFYAGIVEHARSLQLTTDQWFELLSRLPNRILRSELDITRILSEEQLKRLPPISG